MGNDQRGCTAARLKIGLKIIPGGTALARSLITGCIQNPAEMYTPIRK